MKVRVRRHSVLGCVTAALLLVTAACSEGVVDQVDNASSSEIVQTRQLLQERASNVVYDGLPESLSGFQTDSSRILVGQVAAIRGNTGYVDIDESTLSEHEAGEPTVFDQLPAEQVAELTALLEQGELPTPIEVGFDSPLAGWRTVELVVDLEFQIASDGQTRELLRSARRVRSRNDGQ